MHILLQVNCGRPLVNVPQSEWGCSATQADPPNGSKRCANFQSTEHSLYGGLGVQFPDMVEGGIIKNEQGAAKPSGVRTKINDPRIEGPFETGWGFKDFEDQHNLIGLPNPLKE